MQTRDVLGFVLIPVALLGAAWEINQSGLWDVLANMTLPWFCTAVAVSVLLLGCVCLVLQLPPSAIPRRTSGVVVAGTLVIFGAGLVVDGLAYGKPNDVLASVGGWVGFAVVLSGTFALPHLRPGARE